MPSAVKAIFVFIFVLVSIDSLVSPYALSTPVNAAHKAANGGCSVTKK
jgi:hypothetical protein